MERDYDQIMALMKIKAVMEGVGKILYGELLHTPDEAIRYIEMVEELNLDFGLLAYEGWEQKEDGSYNIVGGFLVEIYDNHLWENFVEMSYDYFKQDIINRRDEIELLLLTFEWNDYRWKRIEYWKGRENA